MPSLLFAETQFVPLLYLSQDFCPLATARDVVACNYDEKLEVFL
jgi:hypothetical protein